MSPTSCRLLLLFASLALLAAGALATSCGTSDTTTDNRRVDSESHWLLACSTDDDCGPDLQCWCGACTRVCTKPGEDCEPGVACVPAGGLQATAACIPDGSGTSDAGSTDSGSDPLPTVPGAYLCLPSCSDDSECEGRRCGDIEACLPPGVEGGRGGGGSSGELVCDEENYIFPFEEECLTCNELKAIHRDRLADALEPSMRACTRSTECTTLDFTQSTCLDNGCVAACRLDVVVNSDELPSIWMLDQEIAQTTCLAQGANWQACSAPNATCKWDCGGDELPACVQGHCVDAEYTGMAHVRPFGGPGDTHDRLPMIWPDGETCSPMLAETLTLCEWLATMDGLLVGTLTGIEPIRTTRPDRGQPPLEDAEPWDCPDQHRLAMDLLIEPIARFGAASTEEVTRVTVGPDDLRHWVPQPQIAPRRWGDGALVWGGIPDGVPEREADTLHTGTGRLMPESWRAPGQILVLPVVAGEPDPQDVVRYGLGRHLLGLNASEAEGEPPSRVLFQRADECVEPYGFSEEFRDLSPDNFLTAVEECYTQGLPERPGGLRLTSTPLPPEAFDSLCVSTR